MLTDVEFRSDKFPAYEGEEELINPGLWGKRLAEFLRDKLRGEGFEAGEPIAEDWGWVVPVANKAFRLWVGCGHQYEPDDAFVCFIEPCKPVVWKLWKRVDTRERVESLQQALDRILAGDLAIREQRWWSYEDFVERYCR